jgi:hypothetical protein
LLSPWPLSSASASLFRATAESTDCRPMPAAEKTEVKRKFNS